MAEISRKRVGELVRGVFHLLLPHPDGLPGKLILERLPTLIPPTDFEQSTYPKRPDIRRYEKIVRFSTINAVKAGWLTKNKGLWSLTDEGRRAFDQFPEPEGFALEGVRLYRQWQRQ
jgi:restriction system protein